MPAFRGPVLMAAGGTAGHINPAIAIADGIKRAWPGAEIHFAGRGGGMESRIVPEAGYPFHHIEVRGFRRSFSPPSIARNLGAAWRLALAPSAARRILGQVKPLLAVGAGGYVSGPVLREAALRGVKTAIHEQNALPGVTNRLLAKRADIVFAPTDSAARRLGVPEKTLVAGNPVREAFWNTDREAARRAISAGDRTVILSYGGSNGAQRVNEAAAELAEWHLRCRDFLHIHACGSIEKRDFGLLCEARGISGRENFIVREYIDDMPRMLAAADLVICRAGALTLAELAAVGRPAILVPSPNVAENHQYFNALEFESAGAARVIEENDLGGRLLTDTVDAWTAEPERLREMGARAKALARPRAADMIIEALAGLVGA